MSQPTRFVNLRPSVRSSTTTTSSRPRAFNARTMLLPMNPAPPVTMIMAPSVERLRLRVRDERVVRAAVRANGLARRFDGQIDLRVRVPEVHARQRTVQRQVGARHGEAALRIRRLQLLVDSA